jgi:cytochrome c biogenesis protein CcmG/thiol:disulfide interchange protein DsbE
VTDTTSDPGRDDRPTEPDGASAPAPQAADTGGGPAGAGADADEASVHDRYDQAPHRRPVAPLVALAVAAVMVVVMVGFVIATRSGGGGDSAETELMNRPAPAVVARTLDGETFDLASRRGSWVVLNFFATWCPPCVQEHPELLRFARAQREVGGAELVTVINNDDPDTVRAFLEANGGLGEWPVVDDPQGDAYVDFGVSKVPETWIIDPDGVVRGRIISTVTADSLTRILGALQSAEAAGFPEAGS